MLSLLILPILPLISAATITSTITQSSSPSPTSTPASYSSDTTFQSDTLAAHNFYRGEHNASDLSWNDTSAKTAANWSAMCNFEHSGGPTGENLASGYANASASIDAWGLEREHYSWSSPGFSEATGHFTQLVWSNTTSVGCGRTFCNGKNGTPGWYVVCEYYPAGNVVGGTGGDEYFVDNVKKQVKGKASDTVESGVTSEGVKGTRILWGVMGMVVGVTAAVLM